MIRSRILERRVALTVASGVLVASAALAPAGNAVQDAPVTSTTSGGVVAQATSSAMTSMFLLDKDVRAGSSAGTYAVESSTYGTTPIAFGSGNSDPYVQVLPGASFLSSFSLKNSGSSTNSSPTLCNKFDNRTLKLLSFGDTARPVTALQSNVAYTASTYAVVNTFGASAAAAWHAGSKWNRTSPFTSSKPHNLQADPTWYAVEFGVGEYDPYTPSPTNPAQLAMRLSACRNQDSAAGWFTDPNDPAIQTWINSRYGSGSGITPLDVVNKVRVRLLGPLTSSQAVDAAIRLVARPTYGPTSTGGLAGNPIAYGSVLAAESTFTDSNLATKIGTTYLNGWYVGSYNPASDSGSYGDRIVLAGIDTKPKVYSLWSSPTALNGKSSVAVGTDVWWRNDVTTQAATASLPPSPAPPSVPVRLINVVPVGLTYVPGTGCLGTVAFVPSSCSTRIDPAGLVVNSDGTTTLVWDIGSVTPTNTAVVNSIVFRTTSDATAGAATRYMQAISESVSVRGIVNDRMPTCTAKVTKTNRAVPATALGPAETVAVPTTKCGSSKYRAAEQSIGLTSSADFGMVGSVPAPSIDVDEDDDGSGTRVAYTVKLKNLGSRSSLSDADTIVVLPYVGDGRTPATAFAGSVTLQAVKTSDTVSASPNGLPTASGSPASGLAGTTFYFNKNAGSSINSDPWSSGNLASSSTPWCTQAQFGTASRCPTAMSDVKAVRMISGTLSGKLATRTYTLLLNTTGNSSGNLYSFTAGLRTKPITGLQATNGTSMLVVQSQLGDTMWIDSDDDGEIDETETGRLVGVKLELLNSASVVVASTVTNASGTYTFTGLRSGTYTVRVVSTNGVDGINDKYPTYGASYDYDNTTLGGLDGNPNGTVTVTLARGQTRSDMDFGYAADTKSFSGAISGTAWDDTNGNGVPNASEPPSEGVLIVLLGLTDLNTGVWLGAVTGADGRYSFGGLRAGTYSLLYGGTASSVKAIAGTAGGTPLGPGVLGIALSAGTQASGYDFGAFTVSFGGSVYVDVDGDGTFTPGDIGISGLPISISIPDGVGGTGLLSGSTGLDGVFSL